MTDTDMMLIVLFRNIATSNLSDAADIIEELRTIKKKLYDNELPEEEFVQYCNNIQMAIKLAE